jgi:hypothetical protein
MCLVIKLCLACASMYLLIYLDGLLSQHLG